MFRFGDELFFTGRASCARRAEDGRQKAYEAAVQEVLNYTQVRRLTGVPIERCDRLSVGNRDRMATAEGFGHATRGAGQSRSAVHSSDQP